MKEYITIKDFGPLRNIEYMQLNPYTVLIGESASGKSTLLKVVAMMRYLYKMANIRSYLKHSQIAKSPFRIRLGSMMERQEMGKMLTKKTSITYRVEVADGTSYDICIRDGKLSVPNIASKHLMFRKVSFVSENRNVIPTWAQKAWKNKGATLGFYFHETNDDFAAASEGDKELQLDYVGMRVVISHPKGKPTRYQIVPADNRHEPVELTEASSGIQTSVPLALIVDYLSNDFSFKEAFNRSVISYLYEMENLSKFKAVSEPTALPKIVDIHIEEPELSLFPDAQCKLIDNLIFATAHPNDERIVTMMLATHSPYILNYLNILLNRTDERRAQLTPESLSVYRIFDGELQDLLMRDQKGRWIVDSYDLSEQMDSIYREFIDLGL